MSPLRCCSVGDPVSTVRRSHLADSPASLSLSRSKFNRLKEVKDCLLTGICQLSQVVHSVAVLPLSDLYKIYSLPPGIDRRSRMSEYLFNFANASFLLKASILTKCSQKRPTEAVRVLTIGDSLRNLPISEHLMRTLLMNKQQKMIFFSLQNFNVCRTGPQMTVNDQLCEV